MKENRVWPKVIRGEYIDIIAPSGKVSEQDLINIADYVERWGFKPRIPKNIIGDHPFLANEDELRWSLLESAFNAEDSTIVWCVRGGHGATRLLPRLVQLPKPNKSKLLIGFSDICALHLWLNQAWKWPSIHGPMARLTAAGKIHARDLEALAALCFQGSQSYSCSGLLPLNKWARETTSLEGVTAGGCMTVLQTSFGTPWELDATDKILVLEDVNEPVYRLDRIFIHFANAGFFNKAKALLIGDFGEKDEEDPLIEKMLHEICEQYFLENQIHLPAFRLRGFGHASHNLPLPLGIQGTILKRKNEWVLEF